MKKGLWVIFFLAVLLFEVNLCIAVPSPDFFVVNSLEKKCGIFWPGDEFSHSNLPENWVTYNPQTFLMVSTPFGDCRVEFTYGLNETSYSECCNQLNLAYIDYRLVPYLGDVEKFGKGGWKCLPGVVKDYYFGVMVNKKSNECAALVDFRLVKNDGSEIAYPDEGQCYFADSSWTEYKYPWRAEFEMATPHGKCDNFTILDSESCCNKLGFEYVGYDVGKRSDKSVWRKFLDWLRILFS
jgi:hypothetical protein